MEGAMQRGIIKFFNKVKGFGFIKQDSGSDVFFHMSQRSVDEMELPQDGLPVFFDTRQGPKGLVAERWQLTEYREPLIDLEQDRRDGYRPGVLIALRKKWDRKILLGSRRGTWTFLHDAYHNPETLLNGPQDPEWMYAYGVPQGGIEEGESCEQAIKRELDEELGEYTYGWSELMATPPTFLFKERATFPLKKDGRTWKGKALYAFLVEIQGLPAEVDDFMHGHRGDEFWTLPCPDFEGGVQFYDVPTCVGLINKSLRGPKAAQLVRLIELAA